MTMKIIKTSQLTGPALDWAVAKCEERHGRDNAERFLRDHRIGFTTNYSGVWSQGGPIIEREKIRLDPRESEWKAQDWACGLKDYFGPTALIAAMRCFVASKLGDEVDVPEELLAGSAA